LVITVFSRKGYPYFNQHGAFLEVDLAEEAKDAYKLAKKAYRF